HDMELVGHDDLQGRSAYQPTIHRQRGRFIAYVGHHGGRARNPLTGADEDNGTSIVDVTDPARPRYLAHIPGMPGGPEQGGAQMVRVCDRQGKTYVLRTFGNSLPNSGHEVWDATDPAKPRRVSTVVSGLTSTHKNWWECDTGIAYLISGDLAKTDPLQLGPSGWRTWRMTKIYDLSDPAKPVFIRDFGLAGQEPGSTGPIPVAHGVHGPIVLGNRAYFAYGTSAASSGTPRSWSTSPPRPGRSRWPPSRSRSPRATSAAGAAASAPTRRASRSRRCSTRNSCSSPISTAACARWTSAIPTRRARPGSIFRRRRRGPPSAA